VRDRDPVKPRERGVGKENGRAERRERKIETMQ
jgi:hypothetical protein